MNRSIEELKIRAKILLKTKRREAVPSPETSSVKLKTCLNFVGQEMGFGDWAEARSLLLGESPVGGNQGTFWHSSKCMPFLNLWFADYGEAAQAVSENQSHFLVPYKFQFIVVDQNYLDAIGLGQGCEEDWRAIQRDAVAGYGQEPWHRLVWARIQNIQKN